jgi:hypothetical protein
VTLDILELGNPFSELSGFRGWHFMRRLSSAGSVLYKKLISPPIIVLNGCYWEDIMESLQVEVIFVTSTLAMKECRGREYPISYPNCTCS